MFLAYENGDMGLTYKTEYVVHFPECRSQQPSLVDVDLE